MSTGRFHMRFTGDINRLNAHFQRLSNRVVKLENDLKKMRNESTKTSAASTSGLQKWAAGIGKAIVSYQALTRAISEVNMMHQKRLDLIKQEAERSKTIGELQKAMGRNFYGATKPQLTDLADFGKRVAQDANMNVRSIYPLMGAIGSGTRGNIELAKDVTKSIAPLVAGMGPSAKDIGNLVGSMVDKAYDDPDEAMSDVMSLMKNVRPTEFPNLVYALRTFTAGELFKDKAKGLSREERKRYYQEVLSLFAAQTHAINETGGQITATGVSGALTSLRENFPDMFSDKAYSPFEAIDKAVEEEVAKRLPLSKIRGEGVSKLVSQEMLEGGAVYEMAKEIRKDMGKGADDPAYKAQKEWQRHGTDDIFMAQQERSLEALKDADAHISAKKALLIKRIENYEEQMAKGTWGGMIGSRLVSADQFTRQITDDPEVARERFLRFVYQARKWEDQQRPWYSRIFDHPMKGVVEDEEEIRKMQRRYETGEHVLEKRYAPSQAEWQRRENTIQEALDAIKDWVELEKYKDELNDSRTNTDPTGGGIRNSTNPVTKGLIESNASKHQLQSQRERE